MVYFKPNRMIKRLSLLVVALGWFVVATQAQLPEITFQEFELDNGLRVIMHQDKSVPVVAVSVLYHVGSKNEQPDRTGFAHFFEHLMFEGTQNIARGKYSAIVEESGGALNAYTSFDHTYYYELLPSNQLELGLWLESERMLHLKVDSIGIETQRGVVKEEKKQRYDNQPYGNWLNESLKRTFTVHPYKMTPIGDFAHLNAATYDEFYKFYRSFYVPNNAVLTLSGDIEYDQAKALVTKYFSDIPRNKNAIYRPSVVEPVQTAEVRDTVYDNIQLPALFISYKTPARGNREFYACQMLSYLLSNGESSILYRKLVDQQKSALQAAAYQMETEDPGTCFVIAIANMGYDVSVIEKEINATIDSLQQNIISENDFQKLVNQFENDVVNNFASNAGKAEQLAIAKTYYNDATRINRELDNYLSVTREDIQSVARKYFSSKNRVVLVYLPKAAANS